VLHPEAKSSFDIVTASDHRVCSGTISGRRERAFRLRVHSINMVRSNLNVKDRTNDLISFLEQFAHPFVIIIIRMGWNGMEV
jgi:hypothetical protein